MSVLEIKLASVLSNVDECVGGFFWLKKQKQNHLVFSAVCHFQ